MTEDQKKKMKAEKVNAEILLTAHVKRRVTSAGVFPELTNWKTHQEDLENKTTYMNLDFNKTHKRCCAYCERKY